MRLILATLIAVTVFTTALTGCSKGSDQQPSAAKSQGLTLLQDPLLKKLPPSTAIFSIFDASGAAYQGVKKTPWMKATGTGSLQQVIDQIKSSGASESSLKTVQALYETVQKLGLLSATGESTVDTVMSRSVGFFALAPQDEVPVEAGLYLTAAPGVSLKSKLQLLEQALGEMDLLVSAQKIGGVDGLVAKIPGVPEAMTARAAIYVAATDSLMAISSSKSGAESLFSSAETDTLQNMQRSPDFQKAATAVNSAVPCMSFTFMDLKKISALAETMGLPAAGPSGVREFEPKDIPIDAIAMQQGFGTQLITAISASVSGRTDTQTKVLQALEGSSLPLSMARLPSDTAIAFAFDTKFISKLEDVVKSFSPDKAAEATAAFQQAKPLQGITFGLKNGDGSSPIPDLFVVIEATNRDALGSMAEGLMGQGMAGATGQSAMQWSAKEIEGVPTKFINTMFGAGVYLGSPKGSNSLLISSSERAIKELIAASSGARPGIAASLSAPLKANLAPQKLISLYANLPQLGSLLDSAKSSLAMFTGGSAELDQALDSTHLKKLGLITGSVSYANGLFLLESVMDGPQGAR